MDSTVYIAIFIIIGFVVFGVAITWSSRRTKKREKEKLVEAFDAYAISHALAIDKKQTLNKNMIGIDRLNSKLIFLEDDKGSGQFHLVDLKEIAACRLVSRKNPANGHIQDISLQCTFKGKDKAMLTLPFYNEMKDDLFKMMRLSKKAAYWEKSINIFKESAELSMK